MMGLSARRLATTCAVSAASAVAIMVPGVASASAATTVKGQGSTLQEFAQNTTFIPNYNKSKEAVKDGFSVETYTGTGSGAGLEAWGNGHAAEYNTWEYVGTDQPPNPAQKEAIEKASNGGVLPAKPTLESIPTLQAAVAIIVHLPEGCTAAKSSNKKALNRLMLNNITLEKIFAHEITKWSEIKDDGDALTCGTKADEESAITRVVREEGSGTTAITKKYLYQITQAVQSNGKTWNQMAEENKNLDWPEETVNLLRGKGSGGIVSTVAATAGSIGYVNLANAYGNAAFRGEGGTEFWAFVQDNGLATKGKYADPEKIGKGGLEGTSNCKKDIYVNGVGAEFPPASTLDSWSEVSAATTEKAYSLCGFTYDLSFDASDWNEMRTVLGAGAVPTVAQVELLKSYFLYMINEGPKLFKAQTDYEALPSDKLEPAKSVQAIALKGAEEI
jgi:ABC-type phosphate transport system substrate-binding protein